MNPTLALSEPSVITIESGESLSGTVFAGGRILVGIYVPAAWTSAGVSFEVSYDGVTFTPLMGDEGTEYTVTAVASTYVALDPVKFFGGRYIKLRSGTSGSGVAQAADRDVVVMFGIPATR